ncbi:MFS transporter [Demequina sp. NBRC 110056]|uniref:MFS transporter n=1 Tax=Demequina sp. NBRC 110056 TaxID=1570345 RepID=UPI0009FC33EC|nr:MFS transporter [Demequina sp. NBRC 110056]
MDPAAIRRRFVILTALRWLPTGLAIPVLVLILEQRGLSLATIGLLTALFSLATLLLELPTGGLADALGRRPIIIGAALTGGVAVLILAFGSGVAALATGYVLLGCARALDSGPLKAWFVDATLDADSNADLAPGLSRGGVAESLGLAAGALAAAPLVALSPFPADGSGLIALSTPFLASAALTVVHATLVAVWVRDADVDRVPVREAVRGVGPTIRRGLALAAGSPRIRRLLLLTAGLGVGLSGIELLAPTRASELLGGSDAAAGPYAVLVTAGFAASALGAALSPVATRVMSLGRHDAAKAVSERARPLTIGLAFVTGAAALAAVGVPVAILAAVAYLGFFFAIGIAGPVSEDLLHRAVTRKERATLLSIESMALQTTGLVTAASVGALAQATSIPAALGVAAAVVGASALAMVRYPAADQPSS